MVSGSTISEMVLQFLVHFVAVLQFLLPPPPPPSVPLCTWPCMYSLSQAVFFKIYSVHERRKISFTGVQVVTVYNSLVKI